MVRVMTLVATEIVATFGGRKWHEEIILSTLALTYIVASG